jgi:hypothetical protein
MAGGGKSSVFMALFCNIFETAEWHNHQFAILFVAATYHNL